MNAILCRDCYEDRDLKGTFDSRMPFGAVIMGGTCSICHKMTTCVSVKSEEATAFGRREVRFLTWYAVVLGIAIAVTLACRVMGCNQTVG
jgi:hypothetical protein